MRRDIIVPLDGSPFASAVLPHAMELAKVIDARLVLVRVHQPAALYFAGGEPALVMPPPEWDEESRRLAREWLARKVKEIRRGGAEDVISEFREGVASEEIVASAREHNARAIICTTHGHGGWAPEWLGSVTDAVVRDAPCPVLALNEAATARDPQVKSILALVDGTEESETILPDAAQLARELGASITLARVVAPEWTGDALMMLPPGMHDPFSVDDFAADVKKELDVTASRLRRTGLEVKSVVISHPRPIAAILKFIREANPDLVAAGTSSRGISRLFLRSVADKVLRAGDRPTLLFHRKVEARPQQKAPAKRPAKRRAGVPAAP
jgi:nucleotide-binding universal stress UspA family protein